MHYILNIETATKNCSVSLAQNGATIALRETAEQGYSHAEKLHVFIDEIISETGILFNNLSAVAVSHGPGSYTGLRIGVSTAKGLCYALNIPLISIDTLTSLASKIKIEKGLIIPMIDARRMEVYSSVFNKNGTMIREVKAEILSENSFVDLNETIYFVGDSNEKAKTVLINSNFNFLDNFIYPSANEMSALSFEKYKSQFFEDIAYFEPYYLKDFMVTK